MTETEIRTILKIDSPCCESCHEDQDRGFGAAGLIVIGDERIDVCCATKRAVEKMMKERHPDKAFDGIVSFGCEAAFHDFATHCVGEPLPA